MTIVSVYMAVKNGESTIKKAIASVVWQSLSDLDLMKVVKRQSPLLVGNILL